MVHKSAEDLNKYFPVEILPKEYGGEQYSLEELHGNDIFFIFLYCFFIRQSRKRENFLKYYLFTKCA